MSFNPTLDDKQVGDFGPGAGKVSYGTRTPMDYLRNKTKGAMGPIDPLTGREVGSNQEYEDVIKAKSLEDKFLTMTDMFTQVLNELKAEHPVVRLRLQAGQGAATQGPWQIDNKGSYEFYFVLSGKKVTAEKLFIQNNSASTIYFNFGEPATPGKGALLAGQMMNLAVEV